MVMARRLVLLIALLVAALPPAGAAADIPPGFVGISPQNAGRASDFKLMREAGITNVRLPMYWTAVQSKSPYLADPEWRGYDREIGLAAREGLRIMPFVFGTPPWAAAEATVLPVQNPLQRWGWVAFLRAAAERYGTGGEFWEEHPGLPYLPIKRWEIWNEQNIISFDRNPNPRKYALLLRMSGRALHRTDPTSQVIIGGFFGRPLQVPPNVATGDYLNRIYAAGNVKPYFDGVGLHPYVADARAIVGQMRNLRRVMRRHGDAATPVYMTELGWGSASGPTRWERGLAGQANQLDRAFELISANRHRWRLRGVWWYSWTDEGGTCSFCRTAGLLTTEREAKPAWYRFNRWTGGDPGTVPKMGGREPEGVGG